jgi:signal transduction histidine kinase
VNLVVAAAAAAALVALSLHGSAGLDPAAYALLVLAGAATGLSRRAPRAAVGVVTVVLAVFIVRHYPNGPVWACGWISLFVLSARTDRRTALIGAVTMLGTLSVVAVSVGYGRFTVLVLLVLLGWSAASVALGDVLRGRRAYLDGLRERADFLERTRDEEARRRVAEERLRIARDLHDSVAHAMATINVQAAAAGHVLTRQPEAAAPALAIIQRTSGTVLDELAAMLAVLRSPGERAGREPAPGIDGIGRLVDTARDAGLDVSLTVDGPTGAVSPVLATAAYRIVQESLTNIVRHAAASAAWVTVRAGAGDALAVEVRDDGAGGAAGAGVAGTGVGNPAAGGGAYVPAAGGGVGLVGMRERAEATGGRLTAGPGAGGGFAVRARWEPKP